MAWFRGLVPWLGSVAWFRGVVPWLGFVALSVAAGAARGRCLGVAGHPEILVTARRGGRLGFSHSVADRPPVCRRPCRRSSAELAGRLDGWRPVSRVAGVAAMTIAASAPANCLQPGDLRRRVRRLHATSSTFPGLLWDPADRRNVRLPLCHSQAPKPQHLVVSCPPQLPHLGPAPMSVAIPRRSPDRLRTLCGHRVDGFAFAVHVPSCRGGSVVGGGLAPHRLGTGVLL